MTMRCPISICDTISKTDDIFPFRIYILDCRPSTGRDDKGKEDKFKNRLLHVLTSICYWVSNKLAERPGFEPGVPLLTGQAISNRSDSAALAPLLSGSG